METEGLQKVPGLVQRLVQHTLPGDTGRYQAYFLRLLSGRFTLNIRQDEGALKELILKRLSARQARAFDDCYKKLTKSRALDKKFAVLYLLNKIPEVSTVSIPATPLEQFAVLPEYPAPYRAQAAPSPRPPPQSPLEVELLKDLLYAFQGIEGKYITFSMLEDSYVIQPNIGISESSRKFIYELTEMGWLYNKVTHFIANNIDQLSLTSQSLCYSFQNELTEYYRLIALLEQQISATAGLSLRKLYLWCEEPLERMK